MNEQRHPCVGLRRADTIQRPVTRSAVPGAHQDPDAHPLAHAVRQVLVGASVGLTLSNLVIAQPAQTPPDERIEEVLVTTRQTERYRTDDSALSKFTGSLLDTPQSVTSLSRELLEDRGLNSLNDALRTVPGITLGAGEFSWQGNNPSIRGFSARDDIYLDGIRDFGSYARDPFNLETIEVLLGPSSVLFGRGSTGGAINQVTKRPSLETGTEFSANLGSDETVRATVDMTHRVPLLGDGAAWRLNLLAHDGEVADRDGAAMERFGFAPSLALGLGTDTELTLSYMKQVADDRPDYGLPWLDGQPAPVPRRNYYGFSTDYLTTDADVGTVSLTQNLSERMRLETQLRYARYARESRITEPLITDPVAPGTPLGDIDVFRYVFIGDSEETLAAGQSMLRLDFESGAVHHAFVTGIELAREASEPVFAFGIGAPGTNLLTPTPGDTFTATTTDPRVIADTAADTLAVYAIDTLSFAEAWQVTLGARWDRFDTRYDALRFAGPPTPFNAGTTSGPESIAQTDEVASYRAAVVYKPVPQASLYLAGSTSFNPSAQSLSQLTTGRGLGIGNALLDPEENRSLEAGIKMNLNDGALSFSAAVFEITKTNARIADPTNPGFNTLGGEQRVRGFSADLNGMLLEDVYVTAGYTYLDSEVLRAAPGAPVGAELANTPEHSLSAWINYQITNRFDIGAGARYVSEQFAQSTGAVRSVPSYALLDAMGRYRWSNKVSLKLNLANLTDELYFDQLHPWHVVPGPGFTATFAVNVTYYAC